MTDIASASVSLKYIAMHPKHFEHPWLAVIAMVLKFMIGIFVETINILTVV